MSTELTQTEADSLLAMDKYREDPTKVHEYPVGGGQATINLLSTDQRERFILDVRRRSIQLNRNHFHVRARQVCMLARLDLDDQPHRNPDDVLVPGPHIHLYKEGFGDKWAYPLPECFTDPKDCMLTLKQFLEFCAIRDEIFEAGGLFP